MKSRRERRISGKTEQIRFTVDPMSLKVYRDGIEVGEVKHIGEGKYEGIVQGQTLKFEKL
jgi:hypothetical protein